MMVGFHGLELVALIPIAFTLWMLVDCILNPRLGKAKLPWILLMLFTNFIGALIYLIYGRSKKQSNTVAPPTTTPSES